MSKEKQYVIQCRYEWRSRNGVVWSDWYVYDNNKYSEDSIKAVIKEEIANSKRQCQMLKLKREYRPYDADEYENGLKEMLKSVKKDKKEMDKLRLAAKEKRKKNRKKIQKT